MARTKGKNSKISFDGLGLTKEEDKTLIALLKEKDTSMARLKRFLVRGWMENPTPIA